MSNVKDVSFDWNQVKYKASRWAALSLAQPEHLQEFVLWTRQLLTLLFYLFLLTAQECWNV